MKGLTVRHYETPTHGIVQCIVDGCSHRTAQAIWERTGHLAADDARKASATEAAIREAMPVAKSINRHRSSVSKRETGRDRVIGDAERAEGDT